MRYTIIKIREYVMNVQTICHKPSQNPLYRLGTILAYLLRQISSFKTPLKWHYVFISFLKLYMLASNIFSNRIQFKVLSNKHPFYLHATQVQCNLIKLTLKTLKVRIKRQRLCMSGFCYITRIKMLEAIAVMLWLYAAGMLTC